VTASHRWEERRRLRRLERRRRRGGDQRGPVVLQRTARGVRHGTTLARSRFRRFIRGDRPLLLVTLAVLALAAILLSAPLQSYLDGQARVDHLAVTAEALDRANADLTQRAEDLERDTTVELLAREQLGLVFPGEVAYTLAPPEVDPSRTTANAPVEPAAPLPWHTRLWSQLRELLG
jgi:cell division protein FtsB